jgi:hypothetical protein
MDRLDRRSKHPDLGASHPHSGDRSGTLGPRPDGGDLLPVSKHDHPGHCEPLTPKSDEPPSQRSNATPSLPELSVGVRYGADGSTDVRTNARGVPAMLAYVAVLLMLIVVGGFVTVFAITHPPHEERPRRETQGCTERIERSDHIDGSNARAMSSTGNDR